VRNTLHVMLRKGIVLKLLIFGCRTDDIIYDANGLRHFDPHRNTLTGEVSLFRNGIKVFNGSNVLVNC